MICSPHRPCRTDVHEASHSVGAFLVGAGTKSVVSYGEGRGGIHYNTPRFAHLDVSVCAVLCMAGWAGEHRAFGHAYEAGIAGDYEDVSALGHLPTDAKMRALWLIGGEAWPAVEALARELSHHREIDGEAAERIIRRALPKGLQRAADAARMRLERDIELAPGRARTYYRRGY